MLTNCSYKDVKFEGPPSTYRSSVRFGISYPTVPIMYGETGTGKTTAISQYTVESLRFGDYHGVFALSANLESNRHFLVRINKVESEVLGFNKPGNPTKDFIIDQFPEEFINDKDIIYLWFDSIREYCKKKMLYWKKIKEDYKTFEDFKKSNILEEFINTIDEPYTKINFQNVSLKEKKTNKKDKNNKTIKKEEESKSSVNIDIGVPLSLDISQSELFELKNSLLSIADIDKPKSFFEYEINQKKLKYYYEKPPCYIIWASDLIGTPIMVNSPKSKLVTLIMSIRHNGISFLLDSQAITGGLPKNVRAGGKQFFLFKTEKPGIIKTFFTEVASSVCPLLNDFILFFENMIDGNDIRFMMLDFNEKPTQIRLNWEYIDDAKTFIQKSIEEINKRKNDNENIHKTKKYKMTYDADLDNIFLIKNG